MITGRHMVNYSFTAWAQEHQKATFPKLFYLPLYIAWPCSRTPEDYMVFLPLEPSTKSTLHLFPLLTRPALQCMTGMLQPKPLQSPLLLQAAAKPGRCFFVTQYMYKSSIPKCRICCFQILKRSARYRASFCAVGVIRCSQLSFT